MTDARSDLGKRGERLAEEYLLAQGYRLEERNYRTARGEIDLILWDGGELVFVEVRTRTSLKFGSAVESVTRQKQQKLREIALAYLQTRSVPVKAFRFDVVGVQYQYEHGRDFRTSGGDAGLPAAAAPAITHIRYAF